MLMCVKGMKKVKVRAYQIPVCIRNSCVMVRIEYGPTCTVIAAMVVHIIVGLHYCNLPPPPRKVGLTS